MLGSATDNAPELLTHVGEAPRELEYGCSTYVWSYVCAVHEMLQGAPLAYVGRWDHYAVAATVVATIVTPHSHYLYYHARRCDRCSVSTIDRHATRLAVARVAHVSWHSVRTTDLQFARL